MPHPGYVIHNQILWHLYASERALVDEIGSYLGTPLL